MSNTINIVRGTTNTFDIAITDENGERYLLQAGDVLRFGVKKAAQYEDYEILVNLTSADINAAGDAYTVNLDPSDTENMDIGKYCYDVGLQAGSDYYNVIQCSDFHVDRNVTKREA